MPRKAKNAAVQAAPVANSFPTSAELIEQGFTTKSARIRELGRLGMKTGDIARQETGGLYQHAYNVLHRNLKKPAAAPVVSEASGVETEASE